MAVPRLQWTAQADGVYRSTDGGRSWANVGLESTQHIARIRIHPNDPDLVYAAVLGHLEEPHDERGVYRSRDGGETWERVLYVLGPGRRDRPVHRPSNNPRVLYASLWDVRRSFWWSHSGGPGTGIFRSDDGGDTWTELTGNRGLPEGTMGRIAVAASPREGRVLALIEAEKERAVRVGGLGGVVGAAVGRPRPDQPAPLLQPPVRRSGRFRDRCTS